MANYLLKKIITSTLSDYIENDFDIDLNLFLSGNAFELKNLKLKPSALPLWWPIELVYGSIDKVVVKLPLFSINTKPTHVIVEDIFLVIRIRDPDELKSTTNMMNASNSNNVKHTMSSSAITSSQMLKKPSSLPAYIQSLLYNTKIEALKLLERMFQTAQNQYRQEESEENEDDGADKRGSNPADKDKGSAKKAGGKDIKIPGFVRSLISNIHLRVGNVHLRVENPVKSDVSISNDPKDLYCDALGIFLQGLNIETTDEKGSPKGPSEGNKLFNDIDFKIIEVAEVAMYTDIYCKPFSPSSIQSNTNAILKSKNQFVSDQAHIYILSPFSLRIHLSISDIYPRKDAVTNQNIISPTVYFRLTTSPILLELTIGQIESILNAQSKCIHWVSELNTMQQSLDEVKRLSITEIEWRKLCFEFQDSYREYQLSHKKNVQAKAKYKSAIEKIQLKDILRLASEVLLEFHEELTDTEEEEEDYDDIEGLNDYDDESRSNAIENRSISSYSQNPYQAKSSMFNFMQGLSPAKSPAKDPARQSQRKQQAKQATRGKISIIKALDDFQRKKTGQTHHDGDAVPEVTILNFYKFDMKLVGDIVIPKIQARAIFFNGDFSLDAELHSLTFSLRDYSPINNGESTKKSDLQREFLSHIYPRSYSVRVLQAVNLPNNSQIFFALSVIVDQHQSNIKRTSAQTCSASQLSMWNEHFIFEEIDDTSSPKLRVDCYIQGVGLSNNVLIGTATIDLNQELSQGPAGVSKTHREMWLKLETRAYQSTAAASSLYASQVGVRIVLGKEILALSSDQLDIIQYLSNDTQTMANEEWKRRTLSVGVSFSDLNINFKDYSTSSTGKVFASRAIKGAPIDLVRIDNRSEIFVACDRRGLELLIKEGYVSQKLLIKPLDIFARVILPDIRVTFDSDVIEYLILCLPKAYVIPLQERIEEYTKFRWYGTEYIAKEIKKAFGKSLSLDTNDGLLSSLDDGEDKEGNENERHEHKVHGIYTLPFRVKSFVYVHAVGIRSIVSISLDQPKDDNASAADKIKQSAKNISRTPTQRVSSKTYTSTTATEVNKVYAEIVIGDHGENVCLSLSGHVHNISMIQHSGSNMKSSIGRIGDYLSGARHVSPKFKFYDEIFPIRAILLRFPDYSQPAATDGKQTQHQVQFLLKVPFGWAFHWDLVDRFHPMIPDEVAITSKVELFVSVNDLLVETKGLVQSVPPVIRSVAPVVPYIIVPEIPTLFFSEIDVKVSASLLLRAATESSPDYGARAIELSVSTFAHFLTRAEDNRESVDAEVQFALLLSSLRKQSQVVDAHKRIVSMVGTSETPFSPPPRSARGSRSSGQGEMDSIPEEKVDIPNKLHGQYDLLSVFRAKKFVRKMIERSAKRKQLSWQISHYLIHPTVAKLHASFSQKQALSFETRVISAEAEEANDIESEVKFQMKISPIKVFIWIDDLAFMLSLARHAIIDVSSFRNQVEQSIEIATRDPALDRQYSDSISWQKGITRMSSDKALSAKKESSNDNPNDNSEARTRKRYTKSNDKKKIEAPSVRFDPEFIGLYPTFGCQAFIIIPYRFGKAGKCNIESSAVSVLSDFYIGFGNLPSICVTSKIGFKWDSPLLLSRLDLHIELFNQRRSAWEPLIEPYELHGLIRIDENFHYGLKFVDFEHIRFHSPKILQVTISEQVVAQSIELIELIANLMQSATSVNVSIADSDYEWMFQMPIQLLEQDKNQDLLKMQIFTHREEPLQHLISNETGIGLFISYVAPEIKFVDDPKQKTMGRINKSDKDTQIPTIQWKVFPKIYVETGDHKYITYPTSQVKAEWSSPMRATIINPTNSRNGGRTGGQADRASKESTSPNKKAQDDNNNETSRAQDSNKLCFIAFSIDGLNYFIVRIDRMGDYNCRIPLDLPLDPTSNEESQKFSSEGKGLHYAHVFLSIGTRDGSLVFIQLSSGVRVTNLTTNDLDLQIHDGVSIPGAIDLDRLTSPQSPFMRLLEKNKSLFIPVWAFACRCEVSCRPASENTKTRPSNTNLTTLVRAVSSTTEETDVWARIMTCIDIPDHCSSTLVTARSFMCLATCERKPAYKCPPIFLNMVGKDMNDESLVDTPHGFLGTKMNQRSRTSMFGFKIDTSKDIQNFFFLEGSRASRPDVKYRSHFLFEDKSSSLSSAKIILRPWLTVQNSLNTPITCYFVGDVHKNNIMRSQKETVPSGASLTVQEIDANAFRCRIDSFSSTLSLPVDLREVLAMIPSDKISGDNQKNVGNVKQQDKIDVPLKKRRSGFKSSSLINSKLDVGLSTMASNTKSTRSAFDKGSGFNEEHYEFSEFSKDDILAIYAPPEVPVVEPLQTWLSLCVMRARNYYPQNLSDGEEKGSVNRSKDVMVAMKPNKDHFFQISIQGRSFMRTSNSRTMTWCERLNFQLERLGISPRDDGQPDYVIRIECWSKSKHRGVFRLVALGEVSLDDILPISKTSNVAQDNMKSAQKWIALHPSSTSVIGKHVKSKYKPVSIQSILTKGEGAETSKPENKMLINDLPCVCAVLIKFDLVESKSVQFDIPEGPISPREKASISTATNNNNNNADKDKYQKPLDTNRGLIGRNVPSPFDRQDTVRTLDDEEEEEEEDDDGNEDDTLHQETESKSKVNDVSKEDIKQSPSNPISATTADMATQSATLGEGVKQVKINEVESTPKRTQLQINDEKSPKNVNDNSLSTPLNRADEKGLLSTPLPTKGNDNNTEKKSKMQSMVKSYASAYSDPGKRVFSGMEMFIPGFDPSKKSANAIGSKRMAILISFAVEEGDEPTTPILYNDSLPLNDHETSANITQSLKIFQPPIQMRLTISFSPHQGVCLTVYSKYWIDNETTLPLVISSRRYPTLAQALINPDEMFQLHLSNRSVLSGANHFAFALLDKKLPKISSVTKVHCNNSSSSQIDMKFSGLAWTNRFTTPRIAYDVRQLSFPFQRTLKVTIYHSMYFINSLPCTVEIRAEKSNDRLLLRPESDLIPWKYAYDKFVFRLTDESFGNTEWSALIDPSIAMKEPLPLLFVNQDTMSGRDQRFIVQVFITHSHSGTSLTENNTGAGIRIRIGRDEPYTFAIQNCSNRVIACSQVGYESMFMTIKPGKHQVFGWTSIQSDHMVNISMAIDDNSELDTMDNDSSNQGKKPSIFRPPSFRGSKRGSFSTSAKPQSSSTLSKRRLLSGSPRGSSKRLTSVTKKSSKGSRLNIFRRGRLPSLTKRNRSSSQLGQVLLPQLAAGGYQFANSDTHRFLNATYSLEKVGRLRSAYESYTTYLTSTKAYEMHASVELRGDTRVLVIMDETKESQQMAAMASSSSSSSGFLSSTSYSPYVVRVRVHGARGLKTAMGVPKGNPIVRISCGNQTQETQPADDQTDKKLKLGYPVGDVRFVHPDLKFELDQEPDSVRLEVLLPVNNYMTALDTIDKLSLGEARFRLKGLFPTGDEDDKEPLNTIQARWLDLENGEGGQIEFEVTLQKKDNEEMPRNVIIDLEGLGINLIKSSTRQDLSYISVRKVFFSAIEKGNDASAFVFTLRIRNIQADNQRALAQNPVVLTPIKKEVDILQMCASWNRKQQTVIFLENVEILFQEIQLKLDEEFLGDLLDIFGVIIVKAPGLADNLEQSAKKLEKSIANSVELFSNFANSMRGGNSPSTMMMPPNADDLSTTELANKSLQAAITLLAIEGDASVLASKKQKLPSTPTTLSMLQGYSKIYVRNLHIFGVKATVSFFFQGLKSDYFRETKYGERSWLAPFRALLAGVGKWSDVIIRFDEYVRDNVYGLQRDVAFNVLAHYGKIALTQTWKGIAALDILGNPQHLIERLLVPLAKLCELPIRELYKRGPQQALVVALECWATLFSNWLAAPIESISRILGSISSMIEGLGTTFLPFAFPFRIGTVLLERAQFFIEFFDPKGRNFYRVRNIRKFKNGLVKNYGELPNEYEREEMKVKPINVNDEKSRTDQRTPADGAEEEEEKVDNPEQVNNANDETDEGVGIGVNENYHRFERSRKDSNASSIINVYADIGELRMNEVIVSIPHQDLESGLTTDAINVSKLGIFKVNHFMHCAIMFVPFLNIFWIPIWVLHCLGVLQWF